MTALEQSGKIYDVEKMGGQWAGPVEKPEEKAGNMMSALLSRKRSMIDEEREREALAELKRSEKSQGGYMSEELRPCPVCGSPAEIVDVSDRYNDGTAFYVGCTRCPIRGDEHDHSKDAISEWNSLPSHTATDEKRERETLQNLKRVLSGVEGRSGAWTCINYVRETIGILRDNAPELLELTFIDGKLSTVERVLKECIDAMEIDRPKGFVLQKWRGSCGAYSGIED